MSLFENDYLQCLSDILDYGNKNYDKIDSGKNAHGFGVEFANEFLNGV